MIIIKNKVLKKKKIDEEKRGQESTWSKGIEYFDIKELEKWLPWKARTIEKYIRTRKIRGRKVRKKWLVSRADLYRFLEGK